MTVLIADNDRAVSGLLGEVLQHAGLQAAHAYDGDQASRLARDPAVRVLVCDLDMPGASGVEVLESLRDLEQPPHAMVISGYLDANIEARLRAMPYVHEVMRKPFDLLVFAGVVRRLAAMGGAAESGSPSGSPSGSEETGGEPCGQPQGTSHQDGLGPQGQAEPQRDGDAGSNRGHSADVEAKRSEVDRSSGPFGGEGVSVEH